MTASIWTRLIMGYMSYEIYKWCLCYVMHWMFENDEYNIFCLVWGWGEERSRLFWRLYFAHPRVSRKTGKERLPERAGQSVRMGGIVVKGCSTSSGSLN